MKRAFVYVILLSLFILVIGCDKSSSSETEQLSFPPEIEINVGDYWIAVAHKNVGVEQDCPVAWFKWDWNLESGFAGDNKWKGDWIEWNDAKTACVNYRGLNNSRDWRLPTKAELMAISGNDGNAHSSNVDRKIKFDAGKTWKLYDERAGKKNKYVYFQLSASTVDWLDYFNEGGYYWSNDIDETISTNAWYLFLELNGRSEIISASKSDLGLSVRCVKNV